MTSKNDLTAEVTQLKSLYKKGLLSETTFRMALTDLGQDPSTVFGQQNQRVDTQINVAGDIKMEQGPGDDPAALKNAYLNRLFDAASHLILSGVDPKAAGAGREARLSLGAVYTALFTHTPEDVEGVGSWELGGRGARRLSALDQLNRHHRLVLLGDPGGGKSTLVNFAAMCMAGEMRGHDRVNLNLLTAPLPEDDEKKPQPWDRGALLPVRVILRDLAVHGLPAPGERAAAGDLWRFISKDLESATLGEYADYMLRELREKGGLLLLDGLDEVPEADKRREQIKQMVEDFAAAYPLCRIMVTSRVYAYQRQDWRLNGFDEAMLAPFNDSQIKSFVDAWYTHIASLRNMASDDAKGRAALLKQAIFGGERLLSLAKRPLLLTLMASLHAWRGGSLPEKREELYNDAVDLLLDQWQSQKMSRNPEGKTLVRRASLAEWLRVDRSRVRGVINALAWRAHRAQPDLKGAADVPEADLAAGLMNLSRSHDVNPAKLVDYLCDRAGLLLPRGNGVYTFPHRTFQEYLAACHLTDHDYPDEIARLAREEPERWREVALLAGAKAARGSASTIWSLVDALCFRDPDDLESGPPDAWGALLAGRALLENVDLENVNEHHRGKVDRVRRWLAHLLTSLELPVMERADAGVLLAELGDPRREVLRPEAMPLVRVSAGIFKMGSSEKDGDAENNEKPMHEVDIPHDYRVARHPVANDQFSAFVEAGGYGEPRYWKVARAAGRWKDGKIACTSVVRKDDKFDFNDENTDSPYDYGKPYNLPNHPVVGVSWYEAMAYCEWLTRVWRTERKISGEEEVLLPTEAEWEKAARGVDGRKYPWGEGFDSGKCNMADTGIGAPCTVGVFPNGVSPYGAFDMSGNVWEWTRSLWGEEAEKTDFPYPYIPGDKREDLNAGYNVARVLRGGSYNYARTFVRCSLRVGNNPNYRFNFVGFRVFVSPISSTSGL